MAAGEKTEYIITAVGGPGDEAGGNFSFVAKLLGPPLTEGKVIPTNGRSPTGIFRVNVTAPSTPQDMILRVNVTSTSAAGVSERVTKEVPIKVLTPIVITATVKNEAEMAVKGIPVVFYADGARVFETVINLDPRTSKTLVYNWTDPEMRLGEHIITVTIDPGNEFVKLDTGGTTYTKVIYLGKESYGLTNALLVGIILLSFFLIYLVHRRPRRRRMK
ncbi:MAG: hypothetical protein FJ151_00335 [Euryarchaeota archaeon]|nr:hypothetical protein [Euryarchaeota archaeon]